jgi:hypothetical protein
MPQHTAPDDRGEIHFLCQTAAMFFIGQEIDRQRQPTPGQHCHQTVVAKRTDEAVECHGGDMVEHGTQLQTEPAMRGQ